MTISIKVKTKQQKSKVERLEDGTYLVSVKALPDRNKANVEVISLLSEYFNVTKSQIEIKSGKTSSRKIVSIN
ncbi:MAG TPA: DUF167 domain-containing protein [Candidatus Dojkabacteria bacterium]|jgi:hypothetical protein|nr:DUF167 domain-containing protein [Candidatus Dojkabacteria bacterium]